MTETCAHASPCSLCFCLARRRYLTPALDHMPFSSLQEPFILLVTCPSMVLIFTAWFFLPRYVPTAFVLMVIINLLGLCMVACTSQ
jgi:hypothetical protein